MCSSGITSSATAAFRLRGTRVRRRTRAVCRSSEHARASCSERRQLHARRHAMSRARSMPSTSHRRSTSSHAAALAVRTSTATLPARASSGGIGQSSMSQMARSSSASPTFTCRIGTNAGRAGIDQPRALLWRRLAPIAASASLQLVQAALLRAAAIRSGTSGKCRAPASNATSIVALAGPRERRQQHRTRLGQVAAGRSTRSAAAAPARTAAAGAAAESGAASIRTAPAACRPAPACSKHCVNSWYCDGLIARSAGSVMSTSGSRARTSSWSTDGISFSVSSNTFGSASCSSARAAPRGRRHRDRAARRKITRPGAVRLVGRVDDRLRHRGDQLAAYSR